MNIPKTPSRKSLMVLAFHWHFHLANILVRLSERSTETEQPKVSCSAASSYPTASLRGKHLPTLETLSWLSYGSFLIILL
jgi:hypothetical protein